ncbi:uncharacterized protein LOC143466671 isoform X2 [Clavelina lepadiformis]|uniref:uncharacterized protein LOC143466671 isoform X2 n=1 Tax=Clavelina lepadiformis TaxID=159417 RepID=UPI004042A870
MSVEKRTNIRTVLLVVVGVSYLLFGAGVFRALEREHENIRSKELVRQEENFKRKYNMSDDDYKEITKMVLDLEPHKSGIQWGFVGALYFSITVVTTIGYGHAVPQTFAGKIFCIFYAILGIPLCLVMFQAMGERINSGAKHSFKIVGQRLGFKCEKISHTCLIPFGIISCCLTVLVGSIAFVYFEEWSAINSVYYCVMTLTTIGFGDYVALQDSGALQKRPHYVAFSLIYIMIGLTVIGAFLNLVILRLMVTLPETPDGSTNGDDRTKAMENNTFLSDKVSPRLQHDARVQRHRFLFQRPSRSQDVSDRVQEADRSSDHSDQYTLDKSWEKRTNSNQLPGCYFKEKYCCGDYQTNFHSPRRRLRHGFSPDNRHCSIHTSVPSECKFCLIRRYMNDSSFYQEHSKYCPKHSLSESKSSGERSSDEESVIAKPHLHHSVSVEILHNDCQKEENSAPIVQDRPFVINCSNNRTEEQSCSSRTAQTNKKTLLALPTTAIHRNRTISWDSGYNGAGGSCTYSGIHTPNSYSVDNLGSSIFLQNSEESKPKRNELKLNDMSSTRSRSLPCNLQDIELSVFRTLSNSKEPADCFSQVNVTNDDDDEDNNSSSDERCNKNNVQFSAKSNSETGVRAASSLSPLHEVNPLSLDLEQNTKMSGKKTTVSKNTTCLKLEKNKQKNPGLEIYSESETSRRKDHPFQRCFIRREKIAIPESAKPKMHTGKIDSQGIKGQYALMMEKPSIVVTPVSKRSNDSFFNQDSNEIQDSVLTNSLDDEDVETSGIENTLNSTVKTIKPIESAETSKEDDAALIIPEVTYFKSSLSNVFDSPEKCSKNENLRGTSESCEVRQEKGTFHDRTIFHCPEEVCEQCFQTAQDEGKLRRIFAQYSRNTKNKLANSRASFSGRRDDRNISTDMRLRNCKEVSCKHNEETTRHKRLLTL